MTYITTGDSFSISTKRYLISARMNKQSSHENLSDSLKEETHSGMGREVLMRVPVRRLLVTLLSNKKYS